MSPRAFCSAGDPQRRCVARGSLRFGLAGAQHERTRVISLGPTRIKWPPQRAPRCMACVAPGENERGRDKVDLPACTASACGIRNFAVNEMASVRLPSITGLPGSRATHRIRRFLRASVPADCTGLRYGRTCLVNEGEHDPSIGDPVDSALAEENAVPWKRDAVSNRQARRHLAVSRGRCSQSEDRQGAP